MKRKWSVISWLIIVLNIVGIVCLIRYAIPYITHDTTVLNPDAMLPLEEWDRAGVILTIGFIPLAIANTLAYIFFKVKRKLVRFFFFLPSGICLILVLSDFIMAFI